MKKQEVRLSLRKDVIEALKSEAEGTGISLEQYIESILNHRIAEAHLKTEGRV